MADATLHADVLYETVREQYNLDADLEEFLEAVEGSSTILEIQRELREERARLKSSLTRLGLRDERRAWPPSDIDERIETIRNGELPRRDN